MSPPRAIRGDGTAEAAWRSWDGLERCKPVALDAVLPQDARLVIVAPHPDDELLTCGGLLALHAARGSRCLVVSVTDGEASHAGLPDWDALGLAARRAAERRTGLDRLGANATDVIRIGLPDAAVRENLRGLVAELNHLLEPDDVVVTTWRLDGHPDHDACGDAAAQACPRVGCRMIEAPVWMWHWATPGDARVPWHRMRGLHLPDSIIERRKSAAMSHATQWQRRSDALGPILTPAIFERLDRGLESYFFHT